MAEQDVLKETTPVTGSSTTGTSSLKEGFSHVKGAWGSSLYMKIICCGVVVLFLLFFILMIAFSVSNKNCEGDLAKANKDKASLNSTIRSLRNENDELRTQLETEKRKTSQLQGEINALKKQIEDLNKKITEKDNEISSLKSKQRELEETIEGLKNENNRLRSEISNKESEINHLKNEITTRDHKILNLTNEYNTCFYVGIGLGVTNIGVLIDAIVAHVTISSKNTEIANLTNEVLDLRGKVHNLDTKITELNKQLNASKEEIDHLNQLRQACQAELAQERTLLEDCNHEKAKCLKQLDIIPLLALDQAKLRILMDQAGYALSESQLYKGSDYGYHKGDWDRNMGTNRPNVVIVRTNTGFVFGGYTNQSWDKKGSYLNDPIAFTFSSNNRKICTIKDASKAIIPEDASLFQFGTPEIRVETSDSKHPTGQAVAGRTYDCGTVDATNFYNDGEYFTVAEILAYRVEFTKKP